MGETGIDLLHLLEDLRDAYPATLEETVRRRSAVRHADVQFLGHLRGIIPHERGRGR